jgi:O-antigen ligase
MKALQIILPIYLVLFLVYGRKNIKGFLLLTGIMTLPFRTTYSVLTVDQQVAWTSGITITLSDISFILLFIYLLIHKRTAFRVSPSIALPALCLIVASFWSLINTTWPRMTLFQIIFMTQIFFLYYFVLLNAIESEKELRTVVFFLVASLCLQAVFSSAQFITGNRLDFFSTGQGAAEFLRLTDEGEVPRAYGTIGAPNSFGAYIVPLLLLTLALKLGTKLHNRATLIIGVLGSFALLFCFSRGAWLSFTVSFMLLLWMMRRERMIRFRTVAGAVFVAVIVIALFLPEIEHRVTGYDRNAAMSRIPLLKIAWNMIEEHPVFGVGANTFATVINTYTRTPDLKGIYLHEVHNQYLLVFAETGVFGFIFFAWLMFAFIKDALRFRHHENPMFRALGIGIGLGFVAAGIHMMVDMFNSHILLGSLFSLAAVMSAVGRLSREAETAGGRVKTGRSAVWDAARERQKLLKST